jgi:membrane protease YdiL (CAAX protease family)
MTRAGLVMQAAYAALAAALVAFAGVSAPHAHTGDGPAVAAGLAVALALYSTFARGAQRPPRSLLVPAAAGAVSEEIVWRWGVLAGTAPYLGWAGALALSSAGFAGRHTRTATVAYLVMGGAFGGVFLVTGRLAAAIAAHGGYNLLVLLWRRP